MEKDDLKRAREDDEEEDSPLFKKARTVPGPTDEETLLENFPEQDDLLIELGKKMTLARWSQYVLGKRRHHFDKETGLVRHEYLGIHLAVIRYHLLHDFRSLFDPEEITEDGISGFFAGFLKYLASREVETELSLEGYKIVYQIARVAARIVQEIISRAILDMAYNSLTADPNGPEAVQSRYLPYIFKDDAVHYSYEGPVEIIAQKLLLPMSNLFPDGGDIKLYPVVQTRTRDQRQPPFLNLQPEAEWLPNPLVDDDPLHAAANLNFLDAIGFDLEAKNSGTSAIGVAMTKWLQEVRAAIPEMKKGMNDGIPLFDPLDESPQFHFRPRFQSAISQHLTKDETAALQLQMPPLPEGALIYDHTEEPLGRIIGGRLNQTVFRSMLSENAVLFDATAYQPIDPDTEAQVEVQPVMLRIRRLMILEVDAMRYLREKRAQHPYPTIATLLDSIQEEIDHPDDTTPITKQYMNSPESIIYIAMHCFFGATPDATIYKGFKKTMNGLRYDAGKDSLIFYSKPVCNYCLESEADVAITTTPATFSCAECTRKAM